MNRSYFSLEEDEAYRQGKRDAEYCRHDYEHDKYGYDGPDKAYWDGQKDYEREERHREEERIEEEQEQEREARRQYEKHMEEAQYDAYMEQLYYEEQAQQEPNEEPWPNPSDEPQEIIPEEPEKENLIN